MEALFALFFPLLFLLVWAVLGVFIQREDRKYADHGEFRVQAARAVRIFFIIFFVITVAGMVALALYAFFEPNPLGLFIGLGVLGFFAAISLFGYFYARFNYCVVADDHLLLVRLFGKNRMIPFSKIAYLSAYAEGFLSGFDENGIPLFGFDHTDVGVDTLEKRLRELGIPSAPRPFPTEAMKHTEAYKAYQKRSNRFVWGITVGFLCVSVLVFLIIWMAGN